MTHNVLMGTLNPTHSLTFTTAVTVQMQIFVWVCLELLHELLVGVSYLAYSK